MIEVEAVSEVKQVERSMSQKMCPVFGKKCLGKECMSYYGGSVFNKWDDVGRREEHPNDWDCALPVCKSPLVDGVIVTESN